MRFVSLGTFLAVAFSAQSVLADNDRINTALTLEQDDFAKSKVEAQDWGAAEQELLGLNVPEEDKVFAKLNLAFVYSSTGRVDQAVALYNEVLAEKKNPYALTASGEPRRVKSIARLALAKLSQD